MQTETSTVTSTPTTLRKVPTLSLSNYTKGNDQQKAEFINLLFSGIKDYGFIILKDHDVSIDLLKKSYSLNDEIVYHLKLKNEFAGHRVPSGDPERFFSILFELRDEKGKVVAQKTDRIGETWEWWPAAKKLADNNLNPNEERTFTFAYKPQAKQKLTLAVKVTKNRLNQESAIYNKLDGRYPLYITVFDEKYEVEVR